MDRSAWHDPVKRLKNLEGCSIKEEEEEEEGEEEEEEDRLRLTSEAKVYWACSFTRNITPAVNWYISAVLI